MHIKKIHSIFAAILLLSFFHVSGQYVWRHRACLPVYPQPLLTQFSFVLGTKAYTSIGYTDANSGLPAAAFWMYDYTTDTWTQKNNTPEYLGAPSVFVINDTAYMGLGLDSLGNYQTAFYKYNQQLDSWTSIAPFPGPARYTAMEFVINGMGYVGCGKGGGEYNDFYQYDPVQDLWTEMAAFPGQGRQNGFGVAVRGTGYMGLGYGNGQNYTDNYAYNPDSDAWRPIARIDPNGRDALYCFNLNDTVYVAGGRLGNGGFFADCYMYDSTTNTWMDAPGFGCISPVLGDFYANAVTLGGHGFLIGGGNLNTYFINEVLEFGPVDTAFNQVTQVLGDDTTYCSAFEQELSVDDSCALWSTGEYSSSITVNQPGAYWVTYNTNCGIASDTIHFGIDTIAFTVSDSNATCGAENGSATAVIISGQRPIAYSWGTGDTSATISNLMPGSYPVTVTDAAGCSSTSTAVIDSSGVSSVIIAADSTTFCAGLGTQICAPAGFLSYSWNTGQNTTCIYAQDAGNYYVTVSNGGDCSVESNHIAVNVLPSPSVSLSVSGDTLTCYNGASVQWYYNGTAIPGQTAFIYIAPNSGIYAVLVTDSDGCSSESNGVQVFAAGISLIEEDNNISIYPNPFSQGNVTLEVTPAILGGKAEIYDSKGSMVNGFSINAVKMNLDMNVEAGIYIIRITSGSNIYIRKLVKL